MNDEVPGTYYGMSGKGWTDQELFKHWFQDHFLKYAVPTRPLLLLMDGHSSHYEPSMWELANGYLPSHLLILCLVLSPTPCIDSQSERPHPLTSLLHPLQLEVLLLCVSLLLSVRCHLLILNLQDHTQLHPVLHPLQQEVLLKLVPRK